MKSKIIIAVLTLIVSLTITASKPQPYCGPWDGLHGRTAACAVMP